MKYMAITDQGDSFDVTEEVSAFVAASGDDHEPASARLSARLVELETWEEEHARTRDYGERHYGELRLTEGGDVQ